MGDEEALLRPSALWTREEVLSKPCPVPSGAGIYAWYISGLEELVPLEGCITWQALPLLYVGIAPKQDPSNGGLPSKQSLRTRIRYHFRGNAAGSTLRLTLGCLLAERLGIELRRVSTGERFTFAAGETLLSAWMATHAHVTWQPVSSPWRAEQQLIRSICLPLNLDQNKHHRFHARLTALRREARMRARELPVLT
jgi:hypothetical protein